MPLITCPQDGCEHKVAPTAKACPSCGFAVHDYFLEDLREFSSNKIMQRFDHWVDNGNGTITDTRSGLTWLRAPYGLEWTGEYFFGEAVELTWSEATDRFGKGNKVGLTGSRIDQTKLKNEGIFSNGYVKGFRSCSFGGVLGWRLPTISEYMTLNELMKTVDGLLYDGKYAYYFFDAVFSRGSPFLMDRIRDQYRRMHSATFRTDVSKLFGKNSFFGKKLPGGIVWAYKLYNGTVVDICSEEKKTFLLVCD